MPELPLPLLWWRVLVARWAPWRSGARLRRALQPAADRGIGSSPGDAEHVARRIARAARAVPGSRCLDRALVLTETLRGRGAAAALRLGVRREAGALRAHAWVELDGCPLGESAAALAALAPLGVPELARAVFDR